MSVYAFWNNKGGVGKSYLTFQVACEYARSHPEQKVLVVDLCPQANCSSMLLGGMIEGNNALDQLSQSNPGTTISGYIEDRITSPYRNPNSGAGYLTSPHRYNNYIPANLHLVTGNG